MDQETDRIRIGISACLLGEPVRYNGGHKRDPFIVETLGQYVEFVPFCPEVGCGLPIPRPALRLVGDDVDNPRLVESDSGRDHSERMRAWGEKTLTTMEGMGLCGYIFTAKSPSSGMERIKVYASNGHPVHKGVGFWARMVMERFAHLPFEDNGRLHDMGLRENFIRRLFVARRWQDMEREGRTAGNLVRFHTRHKYLFLAHSTERYRELGKLTAQSGGKGKGDTDALFHDYRALMAKTLALKSTPAKNRNVLQHIMGYFKRQLSPDEKQELLECIEHYAQGHMPLIVPITLLNHYVRKYREPYLAGQHYLRPHPVELQLLNHV